MEGGHAACIGRAIERLAQWQRESIAKDHDLHEQGLSPDNAPWGMDKK